MEAYVNSTLRQLVRVKCSCRYSNLDFRFLLHPCMPHETLCLSSFSTVCFATLWVLRFLMKFSRAYQHLFGQYILMGDINLYLDIKTNPNMVKHDQAAFRVVYQTTLVIELMCSSLSRTVQFMQLTSHRTLQHRGYQITGSSRWLLIYNFSMVQTIAALVNVNGTPFNSTVSVMILVHQRYGGIHLQCFWVVHHLLMTLWWQPTWSCSLTHKSSS